MTSEQRAKASVELSLTYIQNYYPDWRLAKVLATKKLLNDRYHFFQTFIGDVKSHRDENGEATIAHEIKNGFHFDAISHCVQYVEDLFALINASMDPDYFIKRVINYDAGKVINLIKSFNANISVKRISQAFHFPHDLPFTTEDDRRTYDAHVEYLLDLVKEITKFHHDYEYFHNQYKHGLAVGLRPFGNTYRQEQIEQDKRGELAPYLTVYDSRSLDISAKKGTLRIQDGVLMIGFHDNVRPVIAELAKENNFIRLVHPEDRNLNIDSLVEIAYKVRTCICTFLSNYSFKIKPDGNETKFQLPINYKSKDCLVIKCRNEG